MLVVFSLSLLWCLVEVHSQTFPYVSFLGQTLANHSYVDLSLVGTSDSDSVQCVTDLTTCCSGAQGSHRGDWYFPGSTNRLLFSNESGDIFENRGAQRVYLHRRNSAISPVGIYRCEISTTEDISVRATVYVGLYTASGGNLLFQQNSLKVMIICRRYLNIWKCGIDSGLCPQWSQSSVHPHLYLHWWTCYHCHLDQRLHHCH